MDTPVPLVDDGLGNSASLLNAGDGRRAGHRDVSVLDGGAHDWAGATGNSLEQ
jgi:hypothetical protein